MTFTGGSCSQFTLKLETGVFTFEAVKNESNQVKNLLLANKKLTQQEKVLKNDIEVYSSKNQKL